MNKNPLKARCSKTLLAMAFGVCASVAWGVEPDGVQLLQNQTAQPVVSDRIIVKYKTNSAMAQLSSMSRAQMDVASERAGVSMKYLRKLGTGAQLLKLERGQNQAELNAVIARLQADPNVEYAEADLLMKPMATPSDPRYNEQWHYFEPTGGLNLPSAWDITQGAGVVVAVIDTGYRAHADLTANLLPGYDMIADVDVAQDGNGRDSDASDPGDWAPAGACGTGEPAQNSSWHGTHVAGTIAAVTNNGIGIAGVAYKAKIVPVRVLGRCGGYTSDIADGMIWAAGGNVSGVPTNANPAKVLNLSLGGGGTCSTTQQNAINTARSLGATVVVAAGNSNVNASGSTPANCAGVVTVAATNRAGSRSYYSNYGAVVDVAAPGGETQTTANGILSTLNSGSSTPGSDNYAFYQGTSMATPHVAGAAALLYAVKPSITPDEVEATLKSTARAFPGTCSQCGSGIVDANAAVIAANGGGGNPGGNVLTNGVALTGLSGSTNTEIVYTLSVPTNATGLSFAMSGGSGDADMYVKFGSAPTTSSYDCRPYLNGNNESCAISTAQAGTYYVMVRAYSSYSGVSLMGSFTAGGSGSVGWTETNQSGARSSWTYYTVTVPAGSSVLNVDMSGGTGDADVYVRFGSKPTSSSYNCRPYKNGNTESCSLSNPSAGTWHIGVYGYSAYSGVTLSAKPQ